MARPEHVTHIQTRLVASLARLKIPARTLMQLEAEGGLEIQPELGLRVTFTVGDEVVAVGSVSESDGCLIATITAVGPGREDERYDKWQPRKKKKIPAG